VIGSLRSRLIVALVLVTGPALAVLLAGLYLAVARALWDDFDDETREQAELLGSLVEYDVDDGYELEAGESLARLLSRSSTPSYVAIVAPTGPLLDADALAQTAAGWSDRPRTAELADGTRVRGLAIATAPYVEHGVAAPAGEIRVVVAREPAALEARLAAIARWFVLSGAGAVLIAALVAAAVVSRGLRPVAALGERLGAVRDLEGAIDLSPRGLPSELRPIALETGALLDRLRLVLERERALVADVAHELRTPLSVLRTGVDVALQREREPAEYRDRLERMRTTVIQLVELVENLLTLARLDANAIAPAQQPVDLRDLVEETWRPHAPFARSRGLAFTNEVAPGVVVDLDPRLARLVLANLLANAAAYTEPGGWIRVESGDGASILAVRDSGPPIADEDLSRAFDRFWRGDRARSGEGVHCGIGLSLARRLSQAQALRLDLRNEGREVVAELSRA
jgi:signal transduction histidine kinase